MNGIHKIGSDGGGTVALTVPTTSTNTTATLQAKDGTVALIDNVKGFKNYIINGNFDIWQYKDAGMTYPQTSGGYGSDDRWANGSIGSTNIHSRIDCTDTERALFNASYFSRTAVSSVAGASNSVTKFQFIENVTKLAGKTVTLSFWAKADSNKNIAIEFGQVFGTGGTPSSTVTGIGSQLVALTSTWQKFTKTVTIPSIVGKTLGTDGVHTTSTYIDFWFDAGSSLNSRSANLGQQNGTFDIAQVQLEEGSVVTPFEQRPYGLELSLCQRYYEIGQTQPFIGQVNIYDESTRMGVCNFKVSKRITPSMASIGASTLAFPRAYTDMAVCKANSSELAYCFWAASADL